MGIGNSVGNSDEVGNSDDWQRDRPKRGCTWQRNTGTEACSTHAPGMRPGILTHNQARVAQPAGLRDSGDSGDTTPCKVTPVILHGVVSPEVILYGVLSPKVILHGVVSPKVILHGVVSPEGALCGSLSSRGFLSLLSSTFIAEGLWVMV